MHALRTSFAVTLLALAATTTAAQADHPNELSVGVLVEDQNSVQTAPFTAVTLAASRHLGQSAQLSYRVGASAGFIRAFENTGYLAEVGATIDSFGDARRNGFGLELGLGVSAVSLRQTHDQEDLVSLGIAVDPSVVWRRGPFAAYLGLRSKQVLFERIESETMTTSGADYRSELGARAGLRMAF
jgi:hypothetical protein